MSQLRTIIKTRPGKGFGTPPEDYEQLQVKHEFRIIPNRGLAFKIEKIKHPRWEDVPIIPKGHENR